MRIFFKKNSLSFSLIAAILIVSIEVEIWALMLSSLFLLMRLGVEKKWLRPLPQWIINTFAVTALGLVLLQFRTFTGQEPSSTFLVVLASLRILDYKTDRDEKLLIFLGFVLISLKFLYSLDLYWVPVGIAIYLSLWKALLPAQMPSPWKMTTKALLQSLPVVLILFFAFPRVQVPWARKWTPPIASSGFSDSISPGDIANLALNKETVMRVEFGDFNPPINSMYWRGAVLEVSDGFGWKKGPQNNNNPIPTPLGGYATDYKITLEPHFSKVLPVYEHTRMIVTPTFNASKNTRGIFTTSNNISSRVLYQGKSTENWTSPNIENPYALPELPPLTTQWLLERNKEKLSYADKLKTLKDFFTKNNFNYTLNPGTHKDLDDFLFNNRKGFCEHFAGAYAILARGLGVSARVVTGYQGGEMNDSGNFVRVSQADAHAWVEIYDTRGRWRRVDPTFWIAPLRIELGALAYFQLEPTDFGLTPRQALNKLRNQNFTLSLVTTFKNQIESMNYLWIRFLLEFDLAEQQKLIGYFAPQMGWWLTILFTSLFLLRVLGKWLRRPKDNFSPAVKNFYSIEKLLTTTGLTRKTHETPLQFLNRVALENKRFATVADRTSEMFRFERYKNRMYLPEDWDRILRGWKEIAGAKPQAAKGSPHDRTRH